MQNCDEILIECSRSQATFSNGNASWGITIPSIVLEEGDTIQALGSWLSVKNIENSIELFDENNPNATTVNASLNINYWKTMDGLNVVSFPYHSMKWSLSDQFLLGAGFSVPAYQIADNTPSTNEPVFSWTATGSGTDGTNIRVSLVNTYECLKNERNSDLYHKNTSVLDEYGSQGYDTFTDFLINKAIETGISINQFHPQSILDESNTGNRYYLMYRKNNGRYERWFKNVDMKFPIGYYQPSNIASFITDELNLTYYNDYAPNSDLKENWTPAFRYFDAMYPVPLPNLNLTAGFVSKKGNTVNSLFLDKSGKKISGFSHEFPMTMGTVNGLKFKAESSVYSETSESFDLLLYLERCLNNFSGGRDTSVSPVVGGGTFPNSWADMNSAPNGSGAYGVQYNLVFYIPTIGTGANQVTEIYGQTKSFFEISNTPPSTGQITKFPALSYNTANGRWVFNHLEILKQTGTLGSANSGDAFTLFLYWGSELPSAFKTGGGTAVLKNLTPPVSEDLPPSMPMYIGMNSITATGNSTGLRSNGTPYVWFPVGQNRNNDGVTKTATYCVKNSTDWETSNDYFFNYNRGNTNIGGTYGNFQRWSLMNDGEPTPTDDKDEPSLMPILVKYPLFKQEGMKLCIAGSVDTTQEKYMYGIHNSSTVTIGNLSQLGKYILEDKSYATLAEVQARCVLYYNFVKAQVEDGMIQYSTADSIITENSIEKFAFFTHIVLETSNTSDFPDAFTCGDDIHLRNRARGLLTLIKKDEYLKKGSTSLDTSTNIGSHFGISYRKIGDVFYLQLDAYSWIYDKLGGIQMENFGFMDYNNSQSDHSHTFPANTNDTITLTGTLVNSVAKSGGATYYHRFGVGYCYKKSSWRNYTAMLCSYQERNQNPEYLFDSRKNRLPVNDSQFPYGDINYETRIGIGAKNPALVFDADGSSRFYFQQWFQPQTVMNKWFQGIQNTQNLSLATSVNFPIFTYTYFFNDDSISKKDEPDFSTGFSEEKVNDQNVGYSNNFPINQQFGQDCVFYNQDQWEILNNGLYNGAVELPKHFHFDWNVPQADVTNTGVDVVDWRFITGARNFFYQYPVNTNYNDRFFMFNQNARHNSWGGVYRYNDGITYYPDDKNGMTQTGQTTIGSAGIVPCAFWGSASGKEMVIKYDGKVPNSDGFLPEFNPNNQEPFSENMTICPNIRAIYAERCGMSCDTFFTSNDVLIDFNQTANIDTFTGSFWNIIGFSSFDILPNPFQYCNQTRNFTANLLSENPDSYEDTKYISRPITTQASIPVNFNTLQGNRVNTIQDTTQYPSQTYISIVGITAVNRSEQIVSSLLGGVAQSDPANLAPGSLITVSQILGGVSRINQQLINNEMFILVENSDAVSFGSKLYSTGLASKIDSPFYLVRSDLPEDNFKYINNAGTKSILPVVSISNKQYGSGDFYYSDAEYMTFVNKRKRTISTITIEITDSAGNLVNVLDKNSTIFFRIIRNSESPEYEDGDLLNDLPRLEDSLNKKEKQNLQLQIKQLIGNSKKNNLK